VKKIVLRGASVMALVLSMGVASFGQHYTQTNLVSNSAGSAPATDPQLVNPWAFPEVRAPFGGYLTAVSAELTKGTHNRPDSSLAAVLWRMPVSRWRIPPRAVVQGNEFGIHLGFDANAPRRGNAVSPESPAKPLADMLPPSVK
jgi:hypothetical protein